MQQRPSNRLPMAVLQSTEHKVIRVSANLLRNPGPVPTHIALLLSAL